MSEIPCTHFRTAVRLPERNTRLTCHALDAHANIVVLNPSNCANHNCTQYAAPLSNTILLLLLQTRTPYINMIPLGLCGLFGNEEPFLDLHGV